VKGLHEPLVSEELFTAVQDIIKGKKPTIAARKHHNPPPASEAFCEVCRLWNSLDRRVFHWQEQSQEIWKLLVP
jgi:hypothetical protein